MPSPLGAAVLFTQMACALSLQMGLRWPAAPPQAVRAAKLLMTSDEDLMASLKARMENQETSSPPAPLGPDEVGADSMGPNDVVEYIMRSLAQHEDINEGCRVLMAFSIAHDDGQQVDSLGQLQPGCFGSPDQLSSWLASSPAGRYRPLTDVAEWKPMGQPDMSNMSRNAAQKLLVRMDGENWKDLFLNLILADAQVGDMVTKRWMITSMHMSGQ